MKIFQVDGGQKSIRALYKLYRHKLNERIGDKLIKFIDLDRHGLEFTIDAMIDMYDNSTEDSLLPNKKPLDETILKYKRSDTVYLIGSGPSIADIDETTWGKIRTNDSIGFNYSLFLPLVPTFYLFQPDGEMMLRATESVGEKYRDVPILVRPSRFCVGESGWIDDRLHTFNRNINYYIREYPIASSSNIDPFKYFRFMEIQGYLSHGVISKFVPKWRCSLGLLLSLSFQMGYKKIVLCGMDMQSNKHFWNEDKFSYLHNDSNLLIPGDSPVNTFVAQDQIGTTVPNYIYSFSDWVKQRADVSVELISSRTVLYPRLSVATNE